MGRRKRQKCSNGQTADQKFTLAPPGNEFSCVEGRPVEGRVDHACPDIELASRNQREPPRVTVIIVTYNSQRHLKDLLASLAAQTEQRFELLVVDSASSDNSCAVLRHHWPGATVIAARENLGYRRGNQLGMERASGEFFLILNDDVELHPFAIERLLKTAQRNPDAGVIAPAILIHGDAERLNAAGSALMPAGFYSARGKLRPLSEFHNSEEVAAASGCCFLYRASIYRELGGFDPVFDTLPTGWHASVEDLDLCWRAWQAGYRVIYEPSAVIWHKYQQKPLNQSRFASLVSGRLAFVLLGYSTSLLVRMSPVLVATEMALAAFSALQGSGFARSWIRGWVWAWQNRRRLRELRGLRMARRREEDISLTRLMQPTIALAPSLERNLVQHMFASAWSGLNALCLGWRR